MKSRDDTAITLFRLFRLFIGDEERGKKTTTQIQCLVAMKAKTTMKLGEFYLHM